MKNHTISPKGYLNFVILFIGTVCLTFAGINWHNAIAAWLAPVFLLWYSRNTAWKGYWLFFLLLFLAGVFSQTRNNVFNALIVHLMNGLSFAIAYTFIYALDKLLYRKERSFLQTLIFPSIIVVFEYTMSTRVGSWGVLAHTQYPFKPLIQLVTITGLFGVSFVVAWFGAVINWLIEENRSRKTVRAGKLIYLGILMIILLYGSLRLAIKPGAVQEVKVAVVTGETDLQTIVAEHQEGFEQLVENPTLNIPTSVFSNTEAINLMMNRTKEALVEGAKIIVWNEDALILKQTQKSNMIAGVRELAQKNNAYLLMAFLEEDAQRDEKPFNNKCLLVTPEGNIAFEYQKTYLHPLAEAPIINEGDRQLPVVQTSYGKVGACICYDIDFPNYMKQIGKQQIDLLLVPSYDWPGINPLHAEMAEIQALPYGCALIRSNGKGVSVINNAFGNRLAALDKLKTEQNSLLIDLPIYKTTTIYSKIGDVLILFSSLFLIFNLVIKLTMNKKNTNEKGSPTTH